MKTDKFRKIESFKDIEIEKEKLQFQISLAEERISNHFDALANKFSFQNITSKITDGFLGKAYEIVKLFKWGYNKFSHHKEEDPE
jgi:hypothetical protein